MKWMDVWMDGEGGGPERGKCRTETYIPVFD